MKKTILLLFIIFSISFSYNQTKEINETLMINLVVNNSITSVIKVNEIICPKSILPDEYVKGPNYEYCVAEIEFIPEKTIHACTYSESYCINITVNKTLAVVHPTIWDTLFNDSTKKYYNETLDSDIYKIDKTYVGKLKFVGGVFQLMYVEREKYNFNLLEIIIYLLILGIAYYVYKLRKKDD